MHVLAHSQESGIHCEILAGPIDEYGVFPVPTNLVFFDSDGNSNCDGGTIFQYEDDGLKARVTASFTSQTDINAGWELELHLHQGMNWEDWSDQEFPTSYVDDSDVVTDEFEEWTYYIIECGTLTGTGNYEGAFFEISHSPVNYFYGVQVGEMANGFNSGLGLWSWGTLEGTGFDEATQSLVENVSSSMTLRLSIDDDSCVESEVEPEVDFSSLENSNPTFNICDFEFAGLALSGIEQTLNEEISIIQNEGCDLAWDLTPGQPIQLLEAAIGYNEFTIVYEGLCGGYAEETFSITFLECEPEDACLPFSAGENIFVYDCDTSAVILNGSINCNAEGAWEIVSGNGELYGENNPHASYYPNLGTNQLVWHSECLGNPISDTMTVVLFSSSEPGVFCGSDLEFFQCEGMEVSLFGSPVTTPFTPFWLQVSGPPVELSNAESQEPTFNPIQAGTYVFNWGYYSLCGDYIYESQVVSIYENNFYAGDDVEFYLCNDEVNYCLEPELESFQAIDFTWQSVNSDVTLINPFDPYVCVEFDEPGDYLFVLENDNNCGGTFTDTVLVSILEELEPDNICSSFPNLEIDGLPDSILISSQEIPMSYSGIWNQLSGDTELVFSNSQNPETYISNFTNDTYILEWQVLNSLCNSGFSCFQSVEFILNEVPGCTLPYALNYNEEANIDDGSCLFDFHICDCNYNIHSPYELLNLGNGIPNNSSELNFNCETWAHDCDDFTQSPEGDIYGVCDFNLPPENGCECVVEELECQLGDSFLVTDSVWTNDEWNQIELCYSTILLTPLTSSDPCLVETISYSYGNEWTTINLVDQGFVYTTEDQIPFETGSSNVLLSFFISTSTSQSPVSSIWIPECSTTITEQETSFQLFPNPAIDQVVIQPVLNSGYALSCFDLQGKELAREESKNGTSHFSFSEYGIGAGIYLLRIELESGLVEEKLVVKAQ